MSPIPLIPSSSGSGTGTPAGAGLVPGTTARRSLQNVRRIIARKFNSLTLVTTSSAGNATGTTLVATQLANAVDADRYLHNWVMPVDGTAAAIIRRVKAKSALNINDGTLTVAPAFSSQILTNVNVEIHRLLPPDDDDGWTGLRTCINNALREMWTTARVAITGVTGQPSYSLSTYEEWLDPDAVLELRRQALDSTLNSMPAGSFDVVRDADSLTIQVAPTLPGGDASTLEVFRPLDTFIKVAGVWSASTVGMVNDSDEALVSPDLLATVALAHVYEALASTGPDGARYEAKAKDQRLKANVAKLAHLDHRQRRGGSALLSSSGFDSKSFNSFRYDD